MAPSTPFPSGMASSHVADNSSKYKSCPEGLIEIADWREQELNKKPVRIKFTSITRNQFVLLLE